MGEMAFSHFANVMVKLDAATYANLKDDPKFVAASPEAKLKHFSKDFQESVAALFKAGEAHVKSGQTFAIAIYRTIQISGATLEEGSKLISMAFGKSFEKSYMSKLCAAGQVLVTQPGAKGVGDISKLADIARLPENEQTALFAEIDVANTPRKEVMDVVQAKLGVDPKDSSPKAPTKASLMRLIKSLEQITKALPDDGEVADAVEALSAILNQRIEALTAPVATDLEQVDPTVSPSKVASNVAKNAPNTQLPLVQQAR